MTAARTTFSSAEVSSSRLKNWNTKPMWRRRRCASSLSSLVAPLWRRRTGPSVGGMPLTAKEAVEMTTQKTAKVAIVAAVVTASAAACLIGVSPSGATFRGDNGLLVYQAQAGKHIQLFRI